jgi:lipopolysaccharide/colanic/teichoic acid biosynthesis glycosyltransferase
MLRHRMAIVFIGDIFVLIGAFYVMALVRFDLGARSTDQLQFFVLLFALWLIVFFIFDLYTIRRINPNPRNIGLLLAAMGVNTLVGVLIFYIASAGITPKTNLAILVAVTLVLMVLWRRVFYLLFTQRFVRRILIIGNNPLTQHLIQEIKEHQQIGIVVAVWESIPSQLPETQVDLVIAEGIDPQTLLSITRTFNTEVLSLAEAYETIFAKIPLELMNEHTAIHLMVNRTTRAQQYIYRVLEIIIAAVVLIVTSPFVLIALTARWIEDSTPLFIAQHRVGKDGKIFNIYKIRSMKALNANGSAEINGAAMWAHSKDDRITPVGHILRKTHIDEVPQMWNIIKGDLALIGPRAERPEFVRELEAQIPYYYLRHTIKPGFTGWAQIKYRYARSIADSREKFEYDLYYLKHKDPLFDVGIVLKTAQIMFTH